jgi:hypothetical protein
MEKITADFFSLTMVEVTLEPNEHHSVISDSRSRDDMLRDGSRSAGNKGSGGVTAFGPTNVHCLADLEGTVLHGLRRVQERFLNAHGSLAHGTVSRIFVCYNDYARNIQPPLSPVAFKPMQVFAQGCESGQAYCAVFFSDPSP